MAPRVMLDDLEATPVQLDGSHAALFERRRRDTLQPPGVVDDESADRQAGEGAVPELDERVAGEREQLEFRDPDEGTVGEFGQRVVAQVESAEVEQVDEGHPVETGDAAPVQAEVTESAQSREVGSLKQPELVTDESRLSGAGRRAVRAFRSRLSVVYEQQYLIV